MKKPTPNDNGNITRRALLKSGSLIGAALAAQAFLPGLESIARAIGPRSKFVVSQLKYAGGNWDPYPNAAYCLSRMLANYTSIEVEPNRNVITLDSKELFEFPFLYVAGDDAFAPFNRKQQDALLKYLNNGGFVLMDNCSGKAVGGFDSSVRQLADAMFGKDSLKKLPVDHTVYQTFYLIRDEYGGARVLRRYLEGVDVDRLTPLIYSSNNLGGAWPFAWVPLADEPVEKLPKLNPEPDEAEFAKRYGINLVMYALCANYKKDAVHVRAILDRIKSKK